MVGPHKQPSTVSTTAHLLFQLYLGCVRSKFILGMPEPNFGFPNWPACAGAHSDASAGEENMDAVLPPVFDWFRGGYSVLPGLSSSCSI